MLLTTCENTPSKPARSTAPGRHVIGRQRDRGCRVSAPSLPSPMSAFIGESFNDLVSCL